MFFEFSLVVVNTLKSVTTEHHLLATWSSDMLLSMCVTLSSGNKWPTHDLIKFFFIYFLFPVPCLWKETSFWTVISFLSQTYICIIIFIILFFFYDCCRRLLFECPIALPLVKTFLKKSWNFKLKWLTCVQWNFQTIWVYFACIQNLERLFCNVIHQVFLSMLVVL